MMNSGGEGGWQGKGFDWQQGNNKENAEVGFQGSGIKGTHGLGLDEGDMFFLTHGAGQSSFGYGEWEGGDYRLTPTYTIEVKEESGSRSHIPVNSMKPVIRGKAPVPMSNRFETLGHDDDEEVPDICSGMPDQGLWPDLGKNAFGKQESRKKVRFMTKDTECTDAESGEGACKFETMGKPKGRFRAKNAVSLQTWQSTDKVVDVACLEVTRGNPEEDPVFR